MSVQTVGPFEIYGDDAWAQTFTIMDGTKPVVFSEHGSWYCQVVGRKDNVEYRVKATVTTASDGKLTVSLSSAVLRGWVPSMLDVRSVTAAGKVRTWLRATLKHRAAVTDVEWV